MLLVLIFQSMSCQISMVYTAALIFVRVLVQAAMNNMTNEIMLLGVATLILSAVQNDVGKICSAFPSAYEFTKCCRCIGLYLDCRAF